MLLASCAHDYLETSPQSSVEPNQAFADYTSAQMIVNGLGRMMCTQYLSTQGLNGEGTFNLYYGELQGDGLQKCNWTGWSNTINGGYHQNNSNTNAHFTWTYYYKMIANANQILANVPTNIPEEDVDNTKGWAHIKAQALTYRAYAFFRISQQYSRRWSDKQGQSRGIILRLQPTTDEMPASTLAETYQRVYDDLDEALRCFDVAGVKRSEKWQADAQVAHAIYSRAAMNRQDWQTAIDHSQAARKGFTLMGTEQYYKGFNDPNSEWIWAAFNSDEQTTYYYSFFAYAGSNSNTSSCRSYPIAIGKAIVEDIPEEDTRLPLYCIPTEEELPAKYYSKVSGSGKITTTSNKNLSKYEGDDLEYRKLMNQFYNRIRADYADRIYSTTTLYYYLSTKFQSQDGQGVGQVCLFRAAEMIYNEAEAQHMLGNDTEAAALLEEAVKPYNSGYTCSLTGDELMAEIKKYRKFDLHGEGFNWFDLKRWGDDLVRNTYKNGGSWNSSFKGMKPDGANYWTFVIPQMETQYNTLVVGQEEM